MSGRSAEGVGVRPGTVAVDRQAVGTVAEHYKRLASEGNMDGIRGMEAIAQLLIDTDVGPDMEIMLESARIAFDAHWRASLPELSPAESRGA